MKLLTILLFLFIATVSDAQKLEKLLWDNVKECDQAIKNSFEEEDRPEDDADLYEKLKADIKNGYLSIAGTWPTCGCGCDATVAGFKDNAGRYTMMKYEVWNCDDKFGIYASRKLEEVMPENFSLANFTEDGKEVEVDGNSYFHLSMEIPQHGTDTKVKLNLFPLGMSSKSKNGFSYNTEKVKIKLMDIHSIQTIVRHLENEKQLEAILNNKFDEINAKTLHEIDAEVGKTESIKTRAELIEHLLELQEYHKAYSKLKYDNMTLAWDKAAARFTIKSKGGYVSKMSFFDFLKKKAFYSPVC